MRKLFDGINKSYGNEKLKIQDAISDDAQNTYDDIADINPDLLRAIKRGIEPNSEDPLSFDMDKGYIYSGMAFVIKAFHLATDRDLIYNLEKLDAADLQKIQSSLEKGRANAGTDMIEIALQRPRIPAQQTALNSSINGLREMNSLLYDDKFKLGAALGYRSLGEVWGKLFPPKQQAPFPGTPPPSTQGNFQPGA